MDNYVMNALQDGQCNKMARSGQGSVWAYFLATPLEPEMMDRALAICRDCGIVARCFLAHYENDSVIAGGTHPYQRKVFRWKRVDNVGDTNWRSASEFIDSVGRKEE